MSDIQSFQLFEQSEEILAEVLQSGRTGRDFTEMRGQTAAAIDAYHPKRLSLVVQEVVEETETARTYRLARADAQLLPPFLAGQYISLHVTVDGVLTNRAFAISSSPVHREHYDVTVRRVPGGRVSNHLIDTLDIGVAVTSSGPMGTFFHNPLFHGDDLVFLAGGSGVAPAMSMIREIVDRGLDQRFHLIYGSRHHDDVIFRAELDRLAAAHPNIRVDHVLSEPGSDWTGLTGLMSATLLREVLGPLANRMVYVCGPQALYPYAMAQLSTLGHPRRRIRFEANGAPARPDSRPGWPAALALDRPVTVQVKGGPSFATTAGTPLLDALEAHGLQVEAACRSGECSLCRCRVVSGQVFNPEEARLRMSDARSGYVHSCVAYPLTDVEIQL